MSYSPSTITPAGLTIPSFDDIESQLIAQFQSIYGQTVYLGNDSADRQMIGVFALFVSDTLKAIQLDYNNRSPSTAVGAALDSVVKLNGIARKVSSSSTCLVTITGTPGTIINNGVLQDTVVGQKWDLPAVVSIGISGTVSALATCETTGAVAIPSGTLTIIVTPTAGWISATNSAAAIPGQPVETDSQLRARQAVSTELPSSTTLAATIGGVAETLGVTRYNVVENATNAPDSDGNPAHSITAVVEGGADLDVATAIYKNRGIGCFTNGTTSVNITDPNTGAITIIRFKRPVNVPIFATLGVHQLAGYTSAVTTQILNAVVAYLNSLQIGEDLTISALYGAALAVMPNLSVPLFSIQSLVAGVLIGSQSTTDIVVAFDHVVTGIPANIVINLV